MKKNYDLLKKIAAHLPLDGGEDNYISLFDFFGKLERELPPPLEVIVGTNGKSIKNGNNEIVCTCWNDVVAEILCDAPGVVAFLLGLLNSILDEIWLEAQTKEEFAGFYAELSKRVKKG